MAQAKEMLDELKDQAPEADPFPTIRESLAELGANPDKYEKILAKTGETLHWEKVFRPKTTLEAGAITLLAAAKQSGAEPNEYLSRLAPYFDSRIQSLPDLYNALGYVDPRAPTRAVLTRTAREDKRSASTLPHELEHTLQNKDTAKRGYEDFEKLNKVLVPGRPNPVLRFGGMDSLKGDLQKRLSELPEEERDIIAAKHPVFGDYLSSGTELFARIRAKDMLDSAKGEDFLQTDLGQKLFPTDRDRSYFMGSTLPGVPKVTPPYTFESTETKKKPLTDPNTSYARQLYNKLVAPKEYQEGGEVTDEASPDLAQALAVLESNPEKYKSMYQFLLTKGDIANLNDQNLAKEDVAALGLVHAARMSNTEPEAFIENIRPSLQNLPSRQQDVRPSVMLQGSSGGFNTRMPGMNFDMPFVPATLMGRVGAEADIGKDTVRAGLVAGGAYIPNMGVMRNPVMADVGYRTPVAGGTLDIGVGTGVQNPSMKNTNFMANYSRRFAEGGEVTDEFPEEAGVMPGQNPSEAAKRLLYYKKTAAPPMAPSTDQPDGMYQEPTVASETARVFGMQPREDRGNILPIYKPATGLVAPNWMYDIARNATAADMARKGYAVAPEEGVSMALNFTGAGLGVSTAMKKPTGTGGKDISMSTLPSGSTAKDDLAKLLGYSEDIPNEKWLAGKVEDAVSGGTNSFGVPRRMGSTTGYFGKPVEVPVEILAKLPGERAEQSNVRKDSLDYIRKNWDTVSKEAPYIEVDPFGKAWVSEGNHRIMVAKEKGLKTLPVEIRYFSGGQRNAGELAPEKILEYNLPSTTTAKEDLAKVPKAPKGSKAPKVLPKAERDANLEKFMEGSVVPPVYHATTQDFSKFMLSKAGKNTKHPTSKLGIFTATNPDSTNDFITARFNKNRYETGANVMPVHMNIKNPFEISSSDFVFQSMALQQMKKKDADKYIQDFVQSVKDEGHDGLIIKSNPRGFAGGSEFTSDNYVAFEPTQIKSAIGNKGTYDPTNPDITKAKGGEVRKPK
jgi:hypothetical protein